MAAEKYKPNKCKINIKRRKKKKWSKRKQQQNSELNFPEFFRKAVQIFCVYVELLENEMSHNS